MVSCRSLRQTRRILCLREPGFSFETFFVLTESTDRSIELTETRINARQGYLRGRRTGFVARIRKVPSYQSLSYFAFRQ